MKIKRWIIWYWVFIGICLSAKGQRILTTKYEFHDSTRFAQEDTVGVFLKQTDSLTVKIHGDTIVKKLIQKGYLSASIDSFSILDTVVHYWIWSGRKYTLIDLLITPEDQIILQGSGINKIDWSQRTLNQSNIDLLRDRVLSTLSQRGYPFAAVYLDSITFFGKQISSQLKIEKNDYITYDSLAIIGDATVNKSFLEKFLRVEKDQPYNQKNILNLKNLIQGTSFLRFKADPTVSFINQKAYLQLPLINQNASKFDFIIGVLPRNENGVRSFTITGDFTGAFTNKLGNGESFSLQYRRLRPETQNLDLQLNYPFIFNLPFGIDGNFSLFRNTTDFLNLNANLGIEYQLSGRDRLKFGWNLESSRLIDVDTTRLLNLQRLSDQLDVSVTSGNIGLFVDRLNYPFNPSSGWSLRLGINAGQKKINPNATITSLANENIDFRDAYDTLNLSTFQSEIRLDFDVFFNIKDWSTIHIANRSAYKYNQITVYENEYYRLGGNRLLRGFNEETIFSPIYAVFTVEFRILLDQLSYISLPFIDIGRTKIRNLDGELLWDTASGVGIGLNFGTPAGIFNISFAAGNRLGSGFNFGETKIHFGYVNLF